MQDKLIQVRKLLDEIERPLTETIEYEAVNGQTITFNRKVKYKTAVLKEIAQARRLLKEYGEEIEDRTWITSSY